MENNNEFLPIGSVVILKDKNKEVMIIGYLSNVSNNKETYDYCGCIWPIGYTNPNMITLFNRCDIEQIENLGFSNNIQKQFSKVLNTLRNKIDNIESNPTEDNDLDFYIPNLEEMK